MDEMECNPHRTYGALFESPWETTKGLPQFLTYDFVHFHSERLSVVQWEKIVVLA